MREPTIFLDMDEVISDFVGGALREHGWTRDRLEKVWIPGTWSIVEPMEMTQAQFWRPIKAAGIDFWSHLNPTPWFHDMRELMEGRDWYVATNPTECAAAGTGKILWLQSRFGTDFKRYVITPSKVALAHPGCVLIDDREETVKEFRKAGGRGILFPCRHNRLYDCKDPVGYVREQLSKERKNALQVS